MKIEKPQIHFLIDVFPAVTTSTATNTGAPNEDIVQNHLT